MLWQALGHPITFHPLHCIALHCIALRCIALHCTALPCPLHGIPFAVLGESSSSQALAEDALKLLQEASGEKSLQSQIPSLALWLVHPTVIRSPQPSPANPSPQSLFSFLRPHCHETPPGCNWYEPGMRSPWAKGQRSRCPVRWGKLPPPPAWRLASREACRHLPALMATLQKNEVDVLCFFSLTQGDSADSARWLLCIVFCGAAEGCRSQTGHCVSCNPVPTSC